MKRILMASGVLVLASLGSGCGLKGGLERPAPMWGSERTRYFEQQKQAEAAAAAAKEAKKAQRPHVDIPVASEGTTAAPSSGTAAAAASATAEATTGTTNSDTTAPNLKQSGGAVPPVDDLSRPPYSRY